MILALAVLYFVPVMDFSYETLAAALLMIMLDVVYLDYYSLM